MKSRFFAIGAALGCAAFVPLLPLACSGVPEDGELPGAATIAPAGEAEVEPIHAAEAVHPLQRPDGTLPGIYRLRLPGEKKITAACSSPHLTYYGGPLLQSPTIVPVFWSASVNAEVQANMTSFYADIPQTSYWTWLHEYDSVPHAGGSQQVILPGTGVKGVLLKPSVCGGNGSCSMSDQQLQNELNAQISAGVLPEPTVDCTGNTNTIYMVHFPPNVTLGGPSGSGTSCQQFCGYHFTGTVSSGAAKGKPLVYAAIMDTYQGTCALGCGQNGSAFKNQTAVSSHELAEATTDTDIGLLPADATNVAAPVGWYDPNNMCGEIGDICADMGVQIQGAHGTWTVQALWSNAQGNCVTNGNVPAICSGVTTKNCRMCSCADDGVGCNGKTAVCETSTGNVLHGACEQCTSTNATACTNGTCQQSATPANDDVCSCAPLTTCPAGQSCGTAPDGCGGMLQCGACPAPQTCGGGGTPNACGCTPAKACPAGQSCGTAPDGCGGMLQCGTCSAPQTCGGGGTPNVCGCTPAKACPAGQSCGTAPDGCGGMLDCGSCSGGATCVNNQCVGGSSASASGSGGGAAASTGTSTGTGASTGTGGSGNTPGPKGGCSCTAAGDTSPPTRSLLSVMGLLSLGGLMRSRRRRR